MYKNYTIIWRFWYVMSPLRGSGGTHVFHHRGEPLSTISTQGFTPLPTIFITGVYTPAYDFITGVYTPAYDIPSFQDFFHTFNRLLWYAALTPLITAQTPDYDEIPTTSKTPQG